MQIFIYFSILFLIQLFAVVKSAEVVCYVDSSGPSKLTTTDLENALDHCTHLVYGFATLAPKFFTISFDGAVERSVKLTDVAVLKKKYPRIKFILSLGGDRDLSDTDKYLELLEALPEKQTVFIASTLRLLNFYEFDGLDLAYQFPRNEPSKFYTEAIQFWRRIFKKTPVIDPKTVKHKILFTNFVKTMGAIFKAEKKLLTLSVLPNVNSSLYFDIPGIIEHFNLVTLWAFDFNTPLRNPKEADYPAPLVAPPDNGGSRASYNNVNYQIQYWLSQTDMAYKIILAVPAYARSWQMSSKSPRHGMPVVRHTHGPSELGLVTQTPGLLSWPEVCEIVKDPIRVVQGSVEYGQYVIYPPHDNFTHSTWIGFDGPNVAHFKGLYCRAHHLGGMALVDLAMDDFGGICYGTKFPILKYMNGLFN